MQLFINNIVIPLAVDTKLPVILTSPLFLNERGKIPGSFIFNFQVPASEEIRKAFSQAHRPQLSSKPSAELPYIITDGILRFKGNCAVTRANSDIYEVSCRLDNGDFTSKISDKTLKDLDLGGDLPLSNNPLAIALYDSSIEYQEWGGASPFSHEEVYLISTILIDQGQCFDIGDSSYTSPASDTFNFTANFNVGITYGNIYLRIFKNNSLFKEYELLSQHNVIEDSFALASGDVLTFKIYSQSAEVNPEQNSIYFGIAPNSSLEFSSSVPAFVDVVNGDQTTFDFAIFPIHNSEFLSNFPDDAFQIDNLSIKTLYSQYFPVLNYWKDGKFPLVLSGQVEGESFACANLFTPFVYLRKLVDQIISEAGYTCINNPFDSIEFSGAVLFNAFAENNYANQGTTILPVNPVINLTDHVPAVLQSDFIRWISILTGYMPLADSEALTVTFVSLRNKHVISVDNPAVPFPGLLLPDPSWISDDNFKGIKFELKKASADKYLENIKELSEKLVCKGVIEDPRDLPTNGNQVNDYYYCTLNNNYYVYQYSPDTFTLTWCFFGKKFPLVYSEGEAPFLEISTELSPVLCFRTLDLVPCAPESRIWTIPITQQPGILEGFPDSLSAEYGLQVLYYRGMNKDSKNEDYPLGTCRYNDYNHLVYWFIDFSAAEIYDFRYKEFCSWLAYRSKLLTYNSILTTAQLHSLKYDQVYSWNNFYFLIKEIRINLQAEGLSQAEIDILTL